MPEKDNVAMSIILTFTPQLFIPINCDVNVSLTSTSVHDCPVNCISGGRAHEGEAMTLTIN
jgi:hypothetical protein